MEITGIPDWIVNHRDIVNNLPGSDRVMWNTTLDLISARLAQAATPLEVRAREAAAIA